MIRPGQIYQSCTSPLRIRVVAPPASGYLSGYGTVRVATLLADGRLVRERSIQSSQLHESGTTKTGAARRTGYRLVQDAEQAGGDA